MQHKKTKKTKKNKQQKRPYEVVYGVHPIIEMLKAKKRKLVSIYTTKPLPRGWERIKPYLPKYIPNTQYVSRNILSSMAKGSDHMGLVALTTSFPLAKKLFEPSKQPFILVLDGIQDVGNLGGILRSAYCAGVDGVVLCKRGGAELTAAVFKASAGLAEHLPIYQAPSAKFALQEIKHAGYNVYLAVLHNGKNAMDINYKKPLCLVIGSEEKGVSKEILKEGVKVTLPQRLPEISYNAYVASGIFLFSVGSKFAKIGLQQQ